MIKAYISVHRTAQEEKGKYALKLHRHIKGTDLYPHYRYRLDKEHGIEVNHLELVVEKGSSLREREGLESHFYDAVDIHESMDPRLIAPC